MLKVMPLSRSRLLRWRLLLMLAAMQRTSVDAAAMQAAMQLSMPRLHRHMRLSVLSMPPVFAPASIATGTGQASPCRAGQARACPTFCAKGSYASASHVRAADHANGFCANGSCASASYAKGSYAGAGSVGPIPAHGPIQHV